MPTLPFADNIKADITNAVNQGLIVRIPQSEMAYEDWAGIGYIKQNPATFEAGYMLSGGIAGGMTAWGYQRWKEHSEDWFKQLSSGYTGEVSDDADSACYIQKISAYKSEAVVGTVVTLQVMVRDSRLRPVEGAPVTFTVTSGGGNFGVGPDNKPLVTRIVSTEDNGIATIDFTLGVSTSASPSFVKKEGDTYNQQIGINLVDASLANDVMIRSPFTVYGFPDKPVKTERIASSPECDDILDYAGYVGVRVLDKHDNPVSNLPVAFTASINGPRPLLLVPFDAPCCMDGNIPVYGQCGSQGDDLPPIYTSYKGAVAGIIMGGTPNTSHTVTATCGAVTDPEEKTKQFSLTSCGVSEGDIALSGFYYGGNVDACEAGASFPSLARCYVYEKDEDEQFQIRHFDGSVTFEGITGRSMGNYLYTAEVPIDTVGHQDITIKAKQDGETRQTVTLTVCGVDLRLINPDGTDLTEAYVPVDEINASTRDLVLRYKVTPADYIPSNAYIQIIRGRNPFAWLVPKPKPESPGIYTATLPRGTAFIPGIAHPARVVLNYGAAPPLEMWDPDQDNPGIPVYGVLADIDADLYNTGQPNEDDPDEHMTGLLVQVNTPDLKAVELASEIHSGSMTLTAFNLPPTEPDQIQGQVKIWGSPNKTDLLIDMEAGDTTETWEVAGEALQTVYVEGMATSGTHADIDLTLNVINDDGDTVADDLLKVTVCDISIVTDFNRDRKIDDADKQAGANGDVFYFWLNDDNDLEDAPDTDPVTLFGNDDIPALPGGYTMQDRENDIVDNKRDLIDFFPVQIMVTPVGFLDLPNMGLALQTEQGAVNIAYTAIPDGTHAGDYLTDPDTATALQAATTFNVVTDKEYIINNSSFIRQLNTTGQGILIAEGAAAISFDEDNNPADKKKSLVLRFMHGNNTLVANRLRAYP